MIISMTDEISFWKGSSSQWLNIWHFIGALVFAAGIAVGGAMAYHPALFALILPFGYMIWKYLSVSTRVFELTSERLRVTRGVMNQTINEIELYRVKDTQMLRSWWMRLTGLASIHMQTSDQVTPSLIIPAVRGGVELREKLRQQVELMRDQKRVRQMDVDTEHIDDFDHHSS